MLLVSGLTLLRSRYMTLQASACCLQLTLFKLLRFSKTSESTLLAPWQGAFVCNIGASWHPVPWGHALWPSLHGPSCVTCIFSPT